MPYNPCFVQITNKFHTVFDEQPPFVYKLIISVSIHPNCLDKQSSKQAHLPTNWPFAIGSDYPFALSLTHK